MVIVVFLLINHQQPYKRSSGALPYDYKIFNLAQFLHFNLCMEELKRPYIKYLMLGVY